MMVAAVATNTLTAALSAPCPGDAKTGFDKFFEEQMKAAEFAAGYEQARRKIEAVDRVVRAAPSSWDCQKTCVS